MNSLKLVDRLAVAAMFSVSITVATVALADSSPAGVTARSQVSRSDLPQQIRPGMTAAEVLALMGPPHAKMRFDSTKTTAWDYRYVDAWNYDSEFSVILDDDGVVVGKVITRNDP
jgi:outer membrane protein assembly factor BamE (lipoprotein component of BamABCDE complex)